MYIIANFDSLILLPRHKRTESVLIGNSTKFGKHNMKTEILCTRYMEDGENAIVFAVYIRFQFNRVSRSSWRLASRSAERTHIPSIFSSVKVPSAGIR